MSRKKQKPVDPEWSHAVDVETVGEQSLSIEITPDEAEIKALVQRLGVVSLEGIGAKLTLERQNLVIHVSGVVKARVTQNCVVTLDPVETVILEDFEAWFADPEQAASIAKARRERALKKGHTELPILEESEDPEPIIEGKIDLGELAVQYLSLAINPYPHAEGAEYEYQEDDRDEETPEVRKNPFAALKEWKEKLK